MALEADVVVIPSSCTQVQSQDEPVIVATLVSNDNEETSPSMYTQDRLGIVGKYECKLYDKGGKNDYHYVTVSLQSDGLYEWLTRNGAKWSLHINNNTLDMLDVGEESVYYSDGYTSCKIIRDVNGNVTGLLGCGEELFTRVTDFSIDWSPVLATIISSEKESKQIPPSMYTHDRLGIVGKYECKLYDKGGKNDYHYVTVSLQSDGLYEWLTLNGAKWSLHINNNTLDMLDVGEECTYYSDGYTSCKIIRDVNGNVTGLLGCGEELFTRVKTHSSSCICS